MIEAILKPAAIFRNFVCKFRLDFCGNAQFFRLSEVIQSYGPSPEFTAKVTTETVSSANSVDEIVAGAYCQSGGADQGGDGGEPCIGADGGWT
jgi:hypothetical protein